MQGSRPMKSFALLTVRKLTAFILIACSYGVTAATFSWEARSGLWPYEIDPTMTANYDSGSAPVLSANYLALGTPVSPYSDHCYVVQGGANLTAPAQLIIETEFKVVRSESGTANGAGVFLVWVFGGNTSALRFLPGEMWLQSNGGSGRGPSATVANTDDFHRYRIEVDNPTALGSAIRVYYDGTLVITGQTYSDPGGAASIYFGEGSSLGSGMSYWRSFSHNAATSYLTTTPLTISTPSNTAAVIPALKLANHASSSRSTPVAVSATTPSHGTASVSAGALTYTPTTGYSGSDSFLVRFSDGTGLQTMDVNVTVGNGTGGSPNVVYGPTQVEGNFVVRFAGLPGTAYTVETNAAPSGAGWAKKVNVTAPSTNGGFGIGVFEISDPIGEGTRYYRTVWPSY